MNQVFLRLFCLGVLFAVVTSSSQGFAQPASHEEESQIRNKLAELNRVVAELKQASKNRRHLADVEICAKAADWILRHEEFYKPSYPADTLKVLDIGLDRAKSLSDGRADWLSGPGSVVLGYYSKVDGSVQPYALSLPEGVDPLDPYRWPMHIKLHGRGGTRNEVRFFQEHTDKMPEEGQNWIQLDVFGRTDNAYRYAGETDVFEAMADVKRRFRIDEQRMTLWGFSMGGAGAWHLGMHHPSLWSSVGPGAGFVDFYEYQNQSEKLPSYQDASLHIYDSLDYAMNSFNVPVCTYGGELDKQLVASTSMVDAAAKDGISIKLLVGPGMGHKFDPGSFEEFMTFHQDHARKGRPRFPGLRQIRFITYTPKYNQCEWLTIEEMERQYEPAVIGGQIDDDGNVATITTENVRALQVARGVAQSVVIDGKELPLAGAADDLLPGVYYLREGSEWVLLNYEESQEFADNPTRNKRHNLQGPIDDAFMQPFVCVRGTGEPWSRSHQQWADWTLDRFSSEFDKWMRGRVPVVDDRDVNEDLIAEKNLILFGDPGSNSILARVVDQLPVRWERDAVTVNGERYSTDSHGLAMIFPNPLKPSQYVVINSGHTFHEQDFRASNSWLFPRLGDIAVQKYSANSDGSFEESTVWASLFDSNWRLEK